MSRDKRVGMPVVIVTVIMVMIVNIENKQKKRHKKNNFFVFDDRFASREKAA